jgi:hypothetical protein
MLINPTRKNTNHHCDTEIKSDGILSSIISKKMPSKRKITRIGFDLDGVIIGKPPFVPIFLMDLLVRSHENKELSYRFPNTRFERFVRWFSHHPIFRPPIKKNINLIHELYKNKNYELYVVSSRYSFLEKRTKQWFDYYCFDGLFKKIYINLKDEQPHLYKEKMINNLRLNVFIDDDLLLLEYLKKRIDNIELLFAKENSQVINK